MAYTTQSPKYASPLINTNWKMGHFQLPVWRRTTAKVLKHCIASA
ncbi:MAG: hypothetical protein ACKVUS_03545 [Saprospiraceae bacterium]